MTSKTTPQQMKQLMESLVSQGLETAEALPTLKAMMEARITSLSALNMTNMPKSIPKKVQMKLLKGTGKAKRSSKEDGSKNDPKRQKLTPLQVPPVSASSLTKDTILINRSPILTLWATVVAKKLFRLSLEEALTFGSACAANCAHAKGARLGIFGNSEDKKQESGSNVESTAREASIKSEAEPGPSKSTYTLLNQTIEANQTPVGLRAIGNGEEQDPHRIWKSLTKKLGDDLSFVLQQMELAAEQAADDLVATAYSYYLHIRPDIPSGTKGWGAHGHLKVSKLTDFYPIAKNKNKESAY